MKKSIKNFKNYAVDKQGNVYNILTGRCLKYFQEKNGYRKVALYDSEGKPHQLYVHRIVLLTYKPAKHEKNNKLIVNHKNNNKSDNSLKNLEWVTYKQNTNKAKKDGLLKTRGKQRKIVAMLNEVYTCFETITACADYLNRNKKTVYDTLKNVQNKCNNHFIFYENAA